MCDLKDKEKIIDATGIELIPGNHGKDCKGNGTYYDEKEGFVECCCDECDYMILCFPEYVPEGWKKFIEKYINKTC